MEPPLNTLLEFGFENQPELMIAIAGSNTKVLQVDNGGNLVKGLTGQTQPERPGRRGMGSGMLREQAYLRN